MLCIWTFRPHFLIVCYLFIYRTSGGVAIIHLHTLCGVHGCTVSPPLSTTLHTVIRFTCSLYKLPSLHVLIASISLLCLDYNYQLIHIIMFFFQGAAATGSREGDHNSGPTSISSNHHDICPFQRSPNQHPSTLLGEPAHSSWLLHVFCCYRRKEKHFQERRKGWFQRVQVRRSHMHYNLWLYTFTF